MEDLKSLTVRALRDLARKHLGAGHTKLKTKEDLLSALKGMLPELKKSFEALDTAAQVPVEVVKFAKRAMEVTREKVEPLLQKAEEVVAAQAAKLSSAEPRPAEPLVEGFFVARVAGENEARRHHLVEERSLPLPPAPPSPGYDERLGELPHSYGDDASVLLARDPVTLFYFWDFREQTRRESVEGLEGARAVLRVFEGAQLVREIDFALESRSFYLHDLPSGRSYRVETHFVGRDGRSKRVGRSSNVMALPPSGPSSNTAVRFLRVPWETPLKQFRQRLKEGRAEVAEARGAATYLASPGFRAESSAAFPGAPPPPRSDTEQPYHPLPSSAQRTWSSPHPGRG